METMTFKEFCEHHVFALHEGNTDRIFVALLGYIDKNVYNIIDDMSYVTRLDDKITVIKNDGTSYSHTGTVVGPNPLYINYILMIV